MEQGNGRASASKRVQGTSFKTATVMSEAMFLLWNITENPSISSGSVELRIKFPG